MKLGVLRALVQSHFLSPWLSRWKVYTARGTGGDNARETHLNPLQERATPCLPIVFPRIPFCCLCCCDSPRISRGLRVGRLLVCGEWMCVCAPWSWTDQLTTQCGNQLGTLSRCPSGTVTTYRTSPGETCSEMRPWPQPMLSASC